MEHTFEDDIEFGEFSAACDLVESYFGTCIDEVALETPVSRHQLVAVLARAQLSGQQLTDDSVDESKTVFESDDERLFWLDGEFWTTIRDSHHLKPDEGWAAQAVHRRLLRSIDPTENRTDDPFVLIEGSYAESATPDTRDS